jgi:hypothetical protein
LCNISICKSFYYKCCGCNLRRPSLILKLNKKIYFTLKESKQHILVETTMKVILHG